MDKMSRRIKENMLLVMRYKKSNGPRLYRWGLTFGEMEMNPWA